MSLKTPDKKPDSQRRRLGITFVITFFVLWFVLLISTWLPNVSHWIPVPRWALALAILVMMLVMVIFWSVRTRFKNRSDCFEMMMNVGMLLTVLSDVFGSKACVFIFLAISLVGLIGWLSLRPRRKQGNDAKPNDDA